MTVRINKPAINLREELASLRNQGALPKEDKLYLDDLVTNGDFSNGLSGWSNESEGTGTATVVNGELVLTRTDSSNKGRVDNEHTLVTGRTYKLQFEVVSGTVQVKYKSSGSLSQYFNGENWNVLGAGVYTTTFVADGTDGEISIMAIASGTHKVDNVRLQEVGENFVTNGTFDTNLDGWDGFQAILSIVNNTLKVEDNVGTFGYARYEFPTLIGRTYTVKGTLVDATTGNTNANYVQIGTTSSGTAISNNNIGNSNNTDFSFTFKATETTTRISLASGNGIGEFATWDNISVYEGTHEIIQSIPNGYDVKDVYIDGELAREGEAYDYEVRSNGIDQWLKPTVEPTINTETAVIGVRK